MDSEDQTPTDEQTSLPERAVEKPYEPPPPVIVSEADRLKAENLNLKLLNAANRETILQQQMTQLQQQLIRIQEERASLTTSMAIMRQGLEEKYGINLSTHHILPDTGQIIPRDVTPKPLMTGQAR